MSGADKSVGAIIHVRDTRGTYIARAQGLGVQASCTAGAEQAAEACARKVYPDGFQLKRYGNSDTWIAAPKRVEVANG